MSEISGISGPNLTSKPKVSLETTQKQPQIEQSAEVKEMRQFQIEVEQLNHAFALVKEIRFSLEAALHDLSPTE